jgi:hypothetical protein
MQSHTYIVQPSRAGARTHRPTRWTRRCYSRSLGSGAVQVAVVPIRTTARRHPARSPHAPPLSFSYAQQAASSHLHVCASFRSLTPRRPAQRYATALRARHDILLLAACSELGAHTLPRARRVRYCHTCALPAVAFCGAALIRCTRVGRAHPPETCTPYMRWVDPTAQMLFPSTSIGPVVRPSMSCRRTSNGGRTVWWAENGEMGGNTHLIPSPPSARTN